MELILATSSDEASRNRQQRLKAVVLANKGMVLFEDGRKRDALQSLQQSVEIKKDIVNGFYVKFQAECTNLTAKDDLEGALAGFEKVVEYYMFFYMHTVLPKLS